MANKQLNKASTNQTPKLNPEQLPWFDEGYTFSDRERELALLDDLLSTKLADIRFQRQVIRQQIVTGDFGIPITAPAPASAPVSAPSCVACATSQLQQPSAARTNNASDAPAASDVAQVDKE